MVINLSSFFIELSSPIRTCLLTFNMMCHFSEMMFLSWYLPRNVENIPSITHFLTHSLVTTYITLICCNVLQKMEYFTTPMPGWIDTIIQRVMALPVKKLFIISDMDSKRRTISNAKSLSEFEYDEMINRNGKWIQFVVLIDRVIFLIVCLCYLIFFIAYVPIRNDEEFLIDDVFIEDY